MHYIVIDFEWNGTYSPLVHEYFNELIEIGAVKLDRELNIVDEFKEFIRPFHHKKLTGRVKKLTNITNDDIASSDYFTDVFTHFKEWVGEDDNCFMSWGRGDLTVLLENLKFYNRLREKEIIKSFCDAQEFCQVALGISMASQPGLSALAESIGISCENMEMHRALDDSKVTALCVRKLWDEERFNSMRETCDEEFYKKLLFKSVYITDINNPHVDKSLLKRRCPECGKRLEQDNIYPRSKFINVDYTCKWCGKRFVGKHVFKLKYEGVSHKCTLKERVPDEDEEKKRDAGVSQPSAQ